MWMKHDTNKHEVLHLIENEQYRKKFFEFQELSRFSDFDSTQKIVVF